MIEDDETPTRNGEGGAEFQPCVLNNISISLEQIKEIKSKLGVTINDVITGMIFYGIRLYIQELDFKKKTANSTALVLLNTRNIGGYQSIQDMMKTDSKSPWGNYISFLHVPIPTLSKDRLSNPLRFVKKAHEIIKKKRRYFSVFLVGWLLEMEMKLRGREVAAKHMYRTMRKSSVIISSLVGPVERMALANHPVKGLYFTVMGTPECIGITVISYVKTVRITLKTQKGFIEEKKLRSCMEKAFEVLYKDAMERK
ncbi:hypothetical protein L6164_002667 [Bauhinia variegata]|uniref:Uncharacterized protein n=1 Tax=Bauhinia variegata TaxID=167791 RepID=A0ACB9PYW7_BAUVA|nr:hypothetical protein L6164_002667 [Bauhinia variegata]